MKIAPDTNLLMRLAVQDHQEQVAKTVAALKNASSVYLSPIVIVETYWGLRSRYKFTKEQTFVALENLDIPTVPWQQRAQLKRALELAKKGMDFKDAMVATEAEENDHVFCTFDEDAAKHSTGASIPNRLL